MRTQTKHHLRDCCLPARHYNEALAFALPQTRTPLDHEI
jgi:hypothetical protein